jgi:hypothetical protein
MKTALKERAQEVDIWTPITNSNILSNLKEALYLVKRDIARFPLLGKELKGLIKMGCKE